MGIEIKGKNVIVVGLARSGIGAANLLSELGADVTITDIKTEGKLKDFIPRLSPSVRLALGAHPEDIFLSADMLIVSPGVPLDIPPISKARKKGIPIIGELELAYQIVSGQQSAVSSIPTTPSFKSPHPPFTKGGRGGIIGGKGGFLAVTGTNGKSTTTALLDFTIKKGGFRTILGGNIGNALTEEIHKRIRETVKRRNGEKEFSVSPLHPLSVSDIGVDYIVAEVSSFQLESMKDFRPKVAAIVNITPDHLDRYHSFKEYGDTKARIFENQKKGDFLVLNWDDPEIIRVEREKLKVKSEKPRIFYFSRKKEVKGVYFKDGNIYCNLPDP